MECKNCKKEMKEVKIGTQKVIFKDFPAPMEITVPYENYECECGTTLKVLGFKFIWEDGKK